jgi:hypothetical protein
VPSEKFRYLEKSCARSIGAVRSRTPHRIELRIAFIFILLRVAVPVFYAAAAAAILWNVELATSKVST